MSVITKPDPFKYPGIYRSDRSYFRGSSPWKLYGSKRFKEGGIGELIAEITHYCGFYLMKICESRVEAFLVSINRNF